MSLVKQVSDMKEIGLPHSVAAFRRRESREVFRNPITTVRCRCIYIVPGVIKQHAAADITFYIYQKAKLRSRPESDHCRLSENSLERFVL